VLRTEAYLPARYEVAITGRIRCAYCQASPEQGELRLG
jgi:hypothetical protein